MNTKEVRLLSEQRPWKNILLDGHQSRGQKEGHFPRHARNRDCNRFRQTNGNISCVWFEEKRLPKKIPNWNVDNTKTGISWHIMMSMIQGSELTKNMITSWHVNAFRITGPLWGESTGGFPPQSNQLCGVWLFFDANKLFNKESNCCWFETPWCSCDVTVMKGHWVMKSNEFIPFDKLIWPQIDQYILVAGS